MPRLKEFPSTKEPFVSLPSTFIKVIRNSVKNAYDNDPIAKPMAADLADLLLNAIAPDLLHLKQMLHQPPSVIAKERIQLKKISRQAQRLTESLKDTTAKDYIEIDRKKCMEIRQKLKYLTDEIPQRIQLEIDTNAGRSNARQEKERFAQKLATVCQKLSLPVTKYKDGFFAGILETCLNQVDNGKKHNIKDLVQSINLPQETDR